MPEELLATPESRTGIEPAARPGPITPPAVGPPRRLTPREALILELTAQGMSVKQISEYLGCAQSTVRRRISSVCAKMGARNRAEAVRLYEERIARPVKRARATDPPRRPQAVGEGPQAVGERPQAAAERPQAADEPAQAADEPAQATDERSQAADERPQAADEPAQAADEPAQAAAQRAPEPAERVERAARSSVTYELEPVRRARIELARTLAGRPRRPIPQRRPRPSALPVAPRRIRAAALTALAGGLAVLVFTIVLTFAAGVGIFHGGEPYGGTAPKHHQPHHRP